MTHLTIKKTPTRISKNIIKKITNPQNIGDKRNPKYVSKKLGFFSGGGVLTTTVADEINGIISVRIIKTNKK
jgi:hypothetical protein